MGGTGYAAAERAQVNLKADRDIPRAYQRPREGANKPHHRPHHTTTNNVEPSGETISANTQDPDGGIQRGASCTAL